MQGFARLNNSVFATIEFGIMTFEQRNATGIYNFVLKYAVKPSAH